MTTHTHAHSRFFSRICRPILVFLVIPSLAWAAQQSGMRDARSLFSMGELDDALKILVQMVQTPLGRSSSEIQEAKKLAGVIHFLKGNRTEATTLFTDVLQSNPNATLSDADSPTPALKDLFNNLKKLAQEKAQAAQKFIPQVQSQQGEALVTLAVPAGHEFPMGLNISIDGKKTSSDGVHFRAEVGKRTVVLRNKSGKIILEKQVVLKKGDNTLVIPTESLPSAVAPSQVAAAGPNTALPLPPSTATWPQAPESSAASSPQTASNPPPAREASTQDATAQPPELVAAYDVADPRYAILSSVRPPVTMWLPFGAGQFASGETTKGFALGALQVSALSSAWQMHKLEHIPLRNVALGGFALAWAVGAWDAWNHLDQVEIRVQEQSLASLSSPVDPQEAARDAHLAHSYAPPSLPPSAQTYWTAAPWGVEVGLRF